MAQPLPSVANPAAYAAALARNQAAISTVITYGSLQSGDVAANQTLPGSSTLFKNATLDQLKQSLSNIGNPSAYDSNRQQFEASTQQVVDKIAQLSTPQARQDVVSPVPVIPAPVVETPPVMARQDTGSVTIPNPIIQPPPVMARDTTTSSPNIFSSAKPLVLIGIAIFAGASLFLTPKASKRR